MMTLLKIDDFGALVLSSSLLVLSNFQKFSQKQKDSNLMMNTGKTEKDAKDPDSIKVFSVLYRPTSFHIIRQFLMI